MSSQSYIFNPTERTSAAAGDGFSAPRLTSTDRLALSLGVNGKGMMVYDTTLLTLYLWNGTAWVSFSASGYSQGIWSPTFLPATGSITLVPASSTGLWSRIGNMVTVVGHLLFNRSAARLDCCLLTICRSPRLSGLRVPPQSLVLGFLPVQSLPSSPQFQVPPFRLTTIRLAH